MNPTREHLLGYLLGALERTDREQVERELEHDANLRDELRRLQDCVGRIGLADEPDQYSPPAGLAARACRYVALESETLVRPAKPAFSSAPADYLESRSFTWVDLLTAAAVLVAGFALFFPALSHSRFQAEIASCQNHMRQLGLAFHQFSTLDELRRFPWLDETGNRNRAGIYAPTLVNHRLVLDPRTFLCPSDETADLRQMQIPSFEQLDAARGATLEDYYETMGGSYGYHMGHAIDGRLVPPRDARRSNFVLLTDKPSDSRPGRTTANHVGRGQNVLCEDGRVCWCSTVPMAHVIDDPFHNRRNQVAAGLDRDDSVVGRSTDSPLPIRLISDSRR